MPTRTIPSVPFNNYLGRNKEDTLKKSLMAGIIVALLVVPLCAAEKSVGLTLAQIEAERKAMIEEVVAPSQQQAEAFWKNYWQYRGGVKLLTDRTLEVIEEFNSADFSLTGKRSAAMVLEIMNIEKRRAALKQSHVKEFQKILIPKQVVRWYQIERKMDAVIRADLALAIPFNDLAAHSGSELTYETIDSDREKLVAAVVQLLEDQERPFWYEYRNYTKKLTKIYDRSASLIVEYVESYASLNDQQADRMTKEAAKIDADRVKALETLIYSLRSELTGKQMSRLMQGELKMQAIIDLALAVAIPIDE